MVIPVISKNAKRLQQFAEFLKGFVRELNDLSKEGGIVLVEGKRDLKALTDIGYFGKMLSISSLNGKGSRSVLDKAKLIVIMTDSDKEGRRLAARYTRLLSRRGIETSLSYRKRLSAASRGTFLHVENLKRFSYTGIDAEFESGI